MEGKFNTVFGPVQVSTSMFEDDYGHGLHEGVDITGSSGGRKWRVEYHEYMSIPDKYDDPDDVKFFIETIEKIIEESGEV